MNWEWNFNQLPIKPRQMALIGLLILLAFWAQSGFNIDVNHLLFLASNYGIWMLMLPYVFQLSQHLKRPINLVSLLMGSILIIICQWILSNFSLYFMRYLAGATFIPTKTELQAFLLPSIASRIIDLALFTGLLSWLHQQRTLSRQQVLMAQNQAMLQQSKLQLLKNQLNPHFLFNALHSINTLIGINDEKASEMIIKMSHLLRSMLTINEKDGHPLADEIAFVRSYLDIESERFKDRLLIDIQIDPQTAAIMIPTMTLQPLVENAFKHGISKITEKTTLTIKTELQRSELIMSVYNDMPANQVKSKSSGIGLENLSDRLNTYFDQAATVQSKTHGDRFESRITIQL